MAASDYVWPAADVWPDWSAWSVDASLPDVPSARALEVDADDRTLVVSP